MRILTGQRSSGMFHGKPWQSVGTLARFLLVRMPTTKKVHAKIREKAPAGWEHVVKALKSVPGVNPFAVANSMKNKGYRTHDEAGHAFDPHAMLRRHVWDSTQQAPAAQAECGTAKQTEDWVPQMQQAESISPTALGPVLRKGVQDEAKAPKAGSGKRFAKLQRKFAARKGKKKVSDPGALAAFIGRKKFGAKRFGAMGAKGRARAARKAT